MVHLIIQVIGASRSGLKYSFVPPQLRTVELNSVSELDGLKKNLKRLVFLGSAVGHAQMSTLL